jgi:conjugative transfer region protein TrbK
MDTRLFARIGAIAIAAIAITVAALQLREEPARVMPEVIAVIDPDGDPLPMQLRACAGLGEIALSSSDCRAAWAEKRRRFLRHEGAASAPVNDPVGAAAPRAEPQPAKGE